MTVFGVSDSGLFEWSSEPRVLPDGVRVVEAEEFEGLQAAAGVRRASLDAEAVSAATAGMDRRFKVLADKFDDEAAEVLLGYSPKKNNGKGRKS